MSEKKLDVIRMKNPTLLETRPVEKIKSEIIQMLHTTLRNLLASPQDASISIEEGQQTTIFEIDIIQSDFGRLVGSKGRTIGAMRTLVMAIASTHNFRAIIRIKNEGRFF